MINEEQLIEEAIKAMHSAYAPYSNFKVGAALLTKSGKIYTGCNIENSSYSACICAERTVFFKAVSEGETQFESIAVTGGIYGIIKEYAYPCGSCRQVMTEFCSRDFKIISAKSKDDYMVNTLGELLPNSFTKENLI